MNRYKDTELAIRLRFAQWEMGEAAHLIPAGRFSQGDGESLADTLALIVKALRGHPYTVLSEVHRNDDTKKPPSLEG